VIVMRDFEIPETQWIEYFDAFSREHAGWQATIEVLDKQAGPQRIAAGLAFQGISFDQKGTRPCTINVGAGDSTRANVSHSVELPLHIRCADDAEHGEVTIEIEPARGPATLVHLHQWSQ
jgi:Family of unknown function (DUF5335)